MTTINMTNVVNGGAYLRTSREFPEEVKALAFQVSKSYIETATSVNDRIVGIFPTSRPAINGESWFLNANQRQQGLRQVYMFTSTGTIAHGINLNNISQFTRPSGTFTDGTNYYGCIYASNVAIAGQVTFYIDPTNINILAGAGAPAIVSGF